MGWRDGLIHLPSEVSSQEGYIRTSGLGGHLQAVFQRRVSHSDYYYYFSSRSNFIITMHFFLFCFFVKFAVVVSCTERRIGVLLCKENVVLTPSQMAIVPGGGLVKVVRPVGLVLCKEPCRVISLTGGKYNCIKIIINRDSNILN